MNEENNGYVVNCCGVAPEESGRILDDSHENDSASIEIITGTNNMVIPAQDGKTNPPPGWGLKQAEEVDEKRRRRPPRGFEVRNRKSRENRVVPTAACNNRERD